VRLGGKTIAEIKNGTAEYIFSDHLGTPVVGINQSRRTQWRESRTPFGEKVMPSSLRNNRVGYTGHVEDDDLGLVYMQARYYDPVIGRFYSNDPVGFIGNPHSFNRYAYANNNPYKYVDPDGRLPVIPIVVFLLKELAAEGIEQATGVQMPTMKNAGKAIGKNVLKAAHGNSKRSMKPQHLYVILDKKGNVLKPGISGAKPNKNGSPRANSQLKDAPEGSTAHVIKENIPGRQVALNTEQKAVNILAGAKQKMKMHRRPQPQIGTRIRRRK
jgi:RHS repeat-associated protein